MINSCIWSTQPASALRSLLVILTLFVLITSIFCIQKEAYCAQATLAWDPETVSGLAGYRVHYGTVSKNYSSVVDAGNQTSATISGLTAGATYYFAATAYNTSGTESAYSNEIAYTIPSSCSYATSPASASYTSAAATGTVSVTTAGACAWAAVNTASWITITSGASGTGNGTLKYTVSANAGSGSRNASLTIAGLAFTVTQAGVTLSKYSITSSAGTGGSISPAGSVSVTQGASQGYTIAPSSGYSVASVRVDGVSVGAVTSYTFSNVRANHTISATFAATSPSRPHLKLGGRG